jgi:hypothetical protein
MSRKFAWIVFAAFAILGWLGAVLKALHEPELLIIPLIIGAIALFYWAVYTLLVKDKE